MASLAQVAGQYLFFLFQGPDSSIGANSSGGWVLLMGVLWIAAMTYICYRGIEVSARFQRVLLTIEVVMLMRHGIPATVLTAPAAGGYRAGGGEGPAGSEAARAALTALQRVGLLTVAPVTSPPTVQISPVLQAALRAAMPASMLDQASRLAADALLQGWPEQEPPGWPASGLRSCAAALQQVAGDRLWSDGCHPVLLRAGDSLDHARLTGPAVDHWHDLVSTSDQLLGAGHPHTILAGQRLAEACLAADRADDAASWFQRVVDTQAVKLGPEHRNSGLSTRT
jgi:hypothetical protein